eukprot:CAMPEP_0196573592 /NCGR_PEP_ID=MMETSP1081-20130531/3481_1 /TAXON_ID=36882 /ORGANISM="Pyramimonas amylifera, Strain CCMP720" /LENGTH=145 /DNA_ID=CAMNT_0041891361 /DNA_START=176 /DNA_END=613 /DNA_ORIENTATION=+
MVFVMHSHLTVTPKFNKTSRASSVSVRRQGGSFSRRFCVSTRASFSEGLDGAAALEALRRRVRANLGDIAAGVDDPILKEAVKEPVAFLGGLFAGALRLQTSDDPLREWIERTSQAAGVSPEEAQRAAEEKMGSSNEGVTEISIE